MLGKDKFWKNGVGLMPLSMDPLQLKNAHGHEKNHPGTIKEWHETIKSFKSCDADFPISFYGYIDRSEMSPLEDVADQYLKRLDLAVKEEIKVVYLHKSNSYPFFLQRSHDSGSLFNELRSWCLVWFPTIKNLDIKTNSIGGLREFISYNMRYLRSEKLHEKIKNKIEKNQDNLLFLDCKDWWYDGLKTMQKIFDFLELSVCQNRINDWMPKYKEWNKKLKKYDEFETLLPLIAESVVKGKRFNLELLNLNIIEEALILEKLMLEYGVRIKIKNLDVFPKNTIALYNLIKK